MESSASLFVAVGHDGSRLASTDGADWKNLQVGKVGEVYRAIAFGKGHFAAIGSYGGNNIFAATADGTTWQSHQKDAKYSLYLRAVCFGEGAFLALGGDPGGVGDSKPFTMTSPDGVTWSDPFSIAGKNILRRVACGDGLYVGVGDRGRRAASKDGREWSDVAAVKAIDTLVDVAFGKGLFVGVGLNGLRMTTADGLKWSEPERGEEGEHLNSVIWAEDRFVSVGMGATYISADGSSWSRRPNKDAPTTVAYGGGTFVGASWKGRLLRSTDAVEWTPAYKSDHHVEAIAFGILST